MRARAVRRWGGQDLPSGHSPVAGRGRRVLARLLRRLTRSRVGLGIISVVALLVLRSLYGVHQAAAGASPTFSLLYGRNL